MTLKICSYDPIYQKELLNLILSIQQQEFDIPITYEDQPDLADIKGFYHKFWVAILSEKVVGTIGLKIMGDFGIIRKMFVAEEFRGASFGIGQALITELEHEARQHVSKIYLGTTDRYKAAHRFYERNHYIEVSRNALPPEFPVMQVDSKFYRKELK